MSVRIRAISLLVVLALSGCGPSGSENAPPGFMLRLLCGIERWLERNDFRVREEGVGRCAGAARQIETSRERAQEVLRKTLDPQPEEEGQPGDGES